MWCPKGGKSTPQWGIQLQKMRSEGVLHSSLHLTSISKCSCFPKRVQNCPNPSPKWSTIQDLVGALIIWSRRELQRAFSTFLRNPWHVKKRNRYAVKRLFFISRVVYVFFSLTMNPSVCIRSKRNSNRYFFIKIVLPKVVTIKASKSTATTVVLGALFRLQIGPKSLLHGRYSCSRGCFFISFNPFLAPMSFSIGSSFVFGPQIGAKASQIQLIGV